MQQQVANAAAAAAAARAAAQAQAIGPGTYVWFDKGAYACMQSSKLVPVNTNQRENRPKIWISKSLVYQEISWNITRQNLNGSPHCQYVYKQKWSETLLTIFLI